ncbi:uncharacterized protein N7511_002753 [Penicillium nucicola]|uniref:uncharacterized protein n=1 Tax=Penicillium nucicola TaxID=1850975 RepID=UPI00254574DF|nr:uncharacterized protein N7511_002753 [Penicillium nucicola]KAJ5770702.1 hypothetical protein N7511_002753 [Penicillium nucicola]
MTSVLITGATGKQGGSLINNLKNTSFKIFAVTRDINSTSARNLAQKSPNITLIQGNLNDPAAIFQNVKRETSEPVWGVFSVQAANPRNDDERRQGIALIDESLKQRVKFFVYSSVDRGGPQSDTNPTTVPHFIYKHEIEKHLKEKAKGTEMNWTILRPVAFYENFTNDYFGRVFATAWQMALNGKPLQLVATSDIGFFGAAAFTNPEASKNHALSLAGDELTFEEMRGIFERETGRKVPTTFRLPVWLMMAAVKELGVMFRWFHDEGYRADIGTLRRLNPGLKDFGTWLRTEKEVSQLRSTHASPRDSDINPVSEGDDPSSLAKKTELLVIKEGKSRYVGDEASVALGEKISELRDIIESDSDEEDCSPYANSTSNILPQGELFGGESYDGWSLEFFRLHYFQAARIEGIWRVYQENVAPMISIIHKDTIAQIVQNCSAGISLTTSDEALLFAVYYAAVASMRSDICHPILDVEHEIAIQDCKRAVSQGLRRANFIRCQNISVLQAAVLFLLCYRVGGDTCLVWAESAVVIRVAQAQGIHRDGKNFSLPPFETEIRRRLWWHICLLDMLSSGDQGVDTQIRPEMFDTQFPANIDDDDLILNMPNSPKSKSGFTDSTLCIMNSQIMTRLYWQFHGTSKMSTQDRETLVTNLGKDLHKKYLDHFNLDIPIHWASATIVRLQLSKSWLAVHFMSSPSPNSPGTIPSHDDRVFEMAVEIVQFAYLLQTNEATLQWSWLCQSYKEWHVVAFILSELCLRPLNAETDHAWDIVSKMYGLWQRGVPHTDAVLQKPLARLMQRTAASRESKLVRDHSEIPVSLNMPYSATLGLEEDVDLELDAFPEQLSSLNWFSGPFF